MKIVVLQARVKLQQCIQLWTDYSSNAARFRAWLLGAEQTVKELDFKSSLAEKEQQLQTIEVTFEHSSKLDVHTDSLQ